MMEPFDPRKVEELIRSFAGENVYIHLETTNGVYTNREDPSFLNASAFIRNAQIRFQEGRVAGSGPYRVGLKLDRGWVYGDGLTHYLLDEKGRLLLAGLNQKGQLAIALELSRTPFE